MRRRPTRSDDDVAIRDEDNPYDDATGNDADFTEGLLADDEESAIGDDTTGVGEVEDDSSHQSCRARVCSARTTHRAWPARTSG